MALTDKQQSDLAIRVENIQAAVMALQTIYGAADGRNRAGIIDDTHDKVLEIHAGVSMLASAGNPAVLVALTPTDLAAIAKAVADEEHRRSAE